LAGARHIVPRIQAAVCRAAPRDDRVGAKNIPHKQEIIMSEQHNGAASDLQVIAAEGEVFHTLCPGPQASYFSVAHGWTQEELSKVGAKLTYLRSIPDTNELWPHVGHRSESLIREGGNHPPIWARADISDTLLVATLAPNPSGGQLVVRTDSGINSVHDLVGRKIGVPKGRNTKKLDFGRVPLHRGAVNALRVNGVRPEDVTFVDLEHDDFAVEKPSSTPAERAGRYTASKALEAHDVLALAEGQVDAIFSTKQKTKALEATGQYKVIEDLNRYPDWTLTGAGTPVITVSAKLAREHPEIIVAYLRAAIRGGRWVNENPRAAAEIFVRNSGPHLDVEQQARDLAAQDFVPKLDPQALAGLDVQKRFLLEFGYIKNDFDIAAWVEPKFLEEALASLDDSAEITAIAAE
jgi:ABC-type nitrate/sulfonate/bicarbonate transport system substrate-binding protein